MANNPRRRSLLGATGSMGPAPSQAFSPFKSLGQTGVAVFGGRVMSPEKGRNVFGPQRWITYGEMLANTSIIAAGVRYFLNIVAAAKWTVKPADELEAADGEGHMVADFVE